MKRSDWREFRALIATGGRFRRIAGDSRSGTRACNEADIQAARGDDSSARWSETPNGDPYARGPTGTAADSVSAHALRRPRKTARARAGKSQGTRAGWLHLRHSEFAREIQVRRRV